MKQYPNHKKALRIVIATSDPEKWKEFKGQLKSEPDFPIKIIGYAGNGSEALIRCGELEPAMILMELKMEGCDGVTGAQMIRSGFPRIVIMLVGVNSEEEFQYALQAGADGYLRGSFNVQKLIAAIKKVYIGKSLNDEDIYIP
jgi:DNA-binding NarL/FixJ family response regulator